MSSGSTTAAWQAAFCVLVPRSHRCSSDWRAPFKKVLYELLKYPVHRYILACLKMQGQVDYLNKQSFWLSDYVAGTE